MLGALFGNEIGVVELVKLFWLVLPVSFVAGLVGTSLARKVALKYGVVDKPDGIVKTHAEATAYLGGVGILFGVLAGLGVGFWVLMNYKLRGGVTVTTENVHNVQRLQSWTILAGIGVGSIIACGVGLLDDIVDLRPRMKVLGQAMAAMVLVLIGVRPDFTTVYRTLGIPMPEWLDLFISSVMVLVFVLGATNSLNLLDGLDGLCAGVTSIITGAFLVLAVSLATWGYSVEGDPARMIVCLALVGGAMGFFPLNRHPAKIFMGDAGSMLLGFIAGTLMILFFETSGRWSVASIIIFGLPILDTAVALVRRFVNKKPLFISDRGHIYDQFMDRGFGLKKSVKICYLLAILYAVLGFIVVQIRFRYAVPAFIVIFGVSGLIVWRGGYLRMKVKSEK